MSRVEIFEDKIEEFFHDPTGAVAKIVEQDAYLVENEAKRLLLLPGSGRIYRRGGVVHQASAPGEPAASDTGQLLNSVGHRMSEDANGVYAEVGTDVKHGAYTELGTRHMAPRPWLRPALDILRTR